MYGPGIIFIIIDEKRPLCQSNQIINCSPNDAAISTLKEHSPCKDLG